MNAKSLNTLSLYENLPARRSKKCVTDIYGFGARLAMMRKAAGFTQATLALKIGISRRMIAYYECETRHPPTTILPRLTQALGVSADQLLSGNELCKTSVKPKNTYLQRKRRRPVTNEPNIPSRSSVTQYVYQTESDEDADKQVMPLDSSKRHYNGDNLCVREVYHQDDIRIIQGDSRRALADIPDNTFQCCITSPP